MFIALHTMTVITNATTTLAMTTTENTTATIRRKATCDVVYVSGTRTTLPERAVGSITEVR